MDNIDNTYHQHRLGGEGEEVLRGDEGGDGQTVLRREAREVFPRGWLGEVTFSRVVAFEKPYPYLSSSLP